MKTGKTIFKEHSNRNRAGREAVNLPMNVSNIVLMPLMDRNVSLSAPNREYSAAMKQYLVSRNTIKTLIHLLSTHLPDSRASHSKVSRNKVNPSLHGGLIRVQFLPDKHQDSPSPAQVLVRHPASLANRDSGAEVLAAPARSVSPLFSREIS